MKNQIKRVLSVITISSVFMLFMFSCYRLVGVEQEHAAATNSTFNAKVIVKGDGTSDHVTKNQFGLFGIRIPENWSITMSENAMIANAKDGLQLKCDDDGAIGAAKLTRNLIVNERYTQLLNKRYPSAGYKWIGYMTESKFLCHFNNGDEGTTSLEASFVVNTDDKEGEYKLDYVVGDIDWQVDPNNIPIDWDSSNENKNTACATFKSSDTSISNVLNTDTHVIVKSSGVDHIEKKDFSISSNNLGEIEIKFNDAYLNGSKVTIYELNGRALIKDKMTISTKIFNVPANNVYIVNISNGGKNGSQKILVK